MNFGNINNFNPRTFSSRQGRGLETGCAGAYTAGPICKPASKDNILDVHLADASAADVYKGMTADDVIKIKKFKI